MGFFMTLVMQVKFVNKCLHFFLTIYFLSFYNGAIAYTMHAKHINITFLFINAP